MRARSVLLAASLTAVALAAPQGAGQGAALRWAPKEGDEVRYQTVGTFSVQGLEATLTAVNAYKVLRVDPDGSFLVQSTPVGDGKATFGGTEVPVKGKTIMTTYAPTGEVKEIRTEKLDSTTYRMGNLTNFHAPTKPVAVGDAWTSEGKANPTTGATAWKAEYKVVGEETLGPYPAFKMEVTVRETEGTDGGKATGNVWVGKDGVLVRTELNWNNVAVPGAPGPVNGKFIMSRL